MKTTFNIHATVMAELTAEAARRERAMSDLVEAALRRLQQERFSQMPPLPAFHGGEELVDIADRDALDREMGGR